jgi:hypothetical protein
MMWLLRGLTLLSLAMTQRTSPSVPQLPPEIIQSLQRVLSLPAQLEDPLDDLSPNFNAVSSLNNLFPDGALVTLTLDH